MCEVSVEATVLVLCVQSCFINNCEPVSVTRPCSPTLVSLKYVIIIIMGSSNGKPVLRDEDVDTIMKTSGMSEEQVRQDFDIFVKEYPTGIGSHFL